MVRESIATASNFDINWRARMVTLIFATALAALLALAPAAQAQTYTVLHYFTGGEDGGAPVAGLTMAGPGNFYGTSSEGGIQENGTVFHLKYTGSGWVVTTLYSFQGGYRDGTGPKAPVTVGPDGSLYGTTYNGGSPLCSGGCGIVYKLTPPPTFCRAVSCPWTETVLHYFQGADGSGPAAAQLVFDRAGNLYGTTYDGGTYGWGTVFELSLSNGSWTETVLYSFAGGRDGFFPWSGVIFDSAGNLYGTTESGGEEGTVYELSPGGSGWTKSILFDFDGRDQGAGAVGGVVMDAHGNLYGSTYEQGALGGGTAYQLSPSNGQWNYTLLAALPQVSLNGPLDSPALDAAGNLYLTSEQVLNNGANNGAVFEISPSDGGWQLNTLHTFSGSDGAWPTGSVILDADGNIYGTTWVGGHSNWGVIFEITP